MKHFLILFFCCPSLAAAQTVIFDKGHFGIINENGGVREAAENMHNHYLGIIHDRLDDINLNISSLVLVQSMIKNSLTQVNEALKSGLTLIQIGQICREIISESDEMIQTARSDPLSLLFAQDVAGQLKNRGIRLVTEVSGFILKEDGNVLMDYEKRDALLRKIILELKVMRALVYSMNRSMYWARQNGMWKAANPFRDFVNRDNRLTDDIIFNSHLLK
jgi:hypothetical protein